MKQKKSSWVQRTLSVVAIIALTLTSIAMLIAPWTASRFTASASGTMAGTVAKWNPTTTSGYRAGTILFTDTTVSDKTMDAWYFTYDNRNTEVSAQYVSLIAPVTNQMYAYRLDGALPWANVGALLQSGTQTAPVSHWYRWYANNEKIDMSKGTYGLVWSQDFNSYSAYTGLSSAFSGLNYSYPFTGTRSGDTADRANGQVLDSVTDYGGITMDGKWMFFGCRYSDPGNNDARFALFDRPAGIAGSNNWAIEYDCSFGWTSYGGGGGNKNAGLDFVIWDSTTAPSNGSTATWYAIGLYRQSATLKNNRSDTGVYCTKNTGTGGSGWQTSSVALVPGRAGLADYPENTTVRVRVERSGNSITMYINGEQMLHGTNISTANNYKIGFRALSCYVGIDNIRIYALTPQPADSDAEAFAPAAKGMYKRYEWNYNATQID